MSLPVPAKLCIAVSAVCVALALLLSATVIYQRSHIGELTGELEGSTDDLEELRFEREALTREVAELEDALSEATDAAETAELLPSERAGEGIGLLPAGMGRDEAETRVTEALMDGGASLIRELTGLEGVLGGTLGFYAEENITVLNDRWVHAWFEDGHIGGEMLLLYAFDNDDELTWTLIDLATD